MRLAARLGRRSLHAGAFLAAVAASSPVVADDIAPEHGKIVTPDATPVDPGHVEVETVYSYAEARRTWDNGGHLSRRSTASAQELGLSMTVGIFDNLDASIAGAYVRLRDDEYDFDGDGFADADSGSNFGDVDISLRYRFLHSEERALDLAYIAGFTIPAGADSDINEIGTSQEYWSFNQTFAASKDWGRWTANAAVGYALPFGGKRGDARGTIEAGAAVGYQLLDWLQPEFEVNYGRDLVDRDPDIQLLTVTGGLVMPIDEMARINVGVQHGLWGHNCDRETAFIAALKLAY